MKANGTSASSTNSTSPANRSKAIGSPPFAAHCAQGIGTYGTVGRNGKHRNIGASNITNRNCSVGSSSRLPQEQLRRRERISSVQIRPPQPNFLFFQQLPLNHNHPNLRFLLQPFDARNEATLPFCKVLASRDSTRFNERVYGAKVNPKFS
jgi:hypothetical protein